MEEPQKEEATDFYCIPSEVIDRYMLPNLRWNDLLRFRRVCKWTKSVVHGFIRLHPELAPELEINQDDKNFGDFLKMGIPTTRIFLNNFSGEEFYRTAGRLGEKFLKIYRPLVKHLRVAEYSPTFIRQEVAFLKAFGDLETFQADMFGYNAARDKKKKPSPNKSPAIKDRWNIRAIPESLENLKTIKLGNGNNEVFIVNNWFQVTGIILNTCLNIEHITFPFNEYSDVPPGPAFSMALSFMMIHAILEGQGKTGAGSCLKSVDFTNYHSVEEEKYLQNLYMAGPNFPKLCENCIKRDVKLLNVGADWFYDQVVDQPHLGTPVYSLVNLHPNALKMDMPKLEKIEIRSSRHSSPGKSPEFPEWPALKILEIKMDSEMCGYHTFDNTDPEGLMLEEELYSAIKIFYYFFKTVSRPALAELRLQFTDEADPSNVPETEDILSSCPNLMKLELVGWPGTNAELAKLWHGLPGLEEVSFENCKDLGVAAFVGEDVGSPAFLELSKLKRFSLKGLDKMPKITDKLFSLVIRHLPLTHLTLTSSVPLKSVTLSGVRSLLDGKFAESVEKFSFQNWSLANVSTRKMSELKSKFRSFSML